MSSKIFKFILFADDTSLFYSHKNKHDAESILNTELSNISQWLAANKLSLNVGKSKLLVFSNQKSNSKVSKRPESEKTGTDHFELLINGETLKEVNFAKYLGVLIDNKLKWTNQIDAINLKVSKGNGLLAKIRHYVPSSVLRSLYFSFINPHIDYNLLNWSMAASTNLESIENKVKKAVRIISFKDRNEPSTPLFKQLNILPFTYSIKTKLAKFMWKLYNNKLPTTLSANFRTSSRTHISHYESRLVSFDKFILFEGPKIWNNIPNSIRIKRSLKTFSKSLSIHFIDNL